MSVKIFMPSELFYTKTTCDIYGDSRLNPTGVDPIISYYIVTACPRRNGSSDGDCAPHHLRQLGYVVSAGDAGREQKRHDVALRFAYDADTPNIYLVGKSIQLPDEMPVTVLLYDQQKVLQLHENAAKPESESDDMDMLFQLVKRTHKPQKLESTVCRLFSTIVGFPVDGMQWLLGSWAPLKGRLPNAEFYKHHLEHQKFRESRKRYLNLLLDKLLGIAIMLVILGIISHPGDTLLATSHYVIKQVRYLLSNLKGNPVGLKLNAYLNTFLLHCFNYHLNLWAIFLDVIEPVVRLLFVPIALFGLMGFTYQVALLEDLLGVMGLHASCFYIYSSVLYKVEIKGLDALWKIVRGKRYNKLKNRVESFEYSSCQLFLATVFFSSLLFLFPTVLVYYVVFTTLRLCLSGVYYVMRQVRRRLLEFPLHVLVKFLNGNFYQKESLQLQHIQHASSPLLLAINLQMSVFKINVQSSSFGRVLTCSSGVLQELMSIEHSTFKSIFDSILKGTF